MGSAKPMRPKVGLVRLALGCATAFALTLAVAVSPAEAMVATQLQIGGQLVGTPKITLPHTAQLATSSVAAHAKHIDTWQTKKKRRKAKVANPDNLPQPMIQIIPGSKINLLSRSSKMPIAIKNGYSTQVRVRVRVVATNLKVLIPEVVEVVVPANTTVTAKVPVNAIADGDVILHATLESFSGLRLTKPVSIQMNVILGVEDTVLYGFFSFIAALGALGAYRTVRKRRREASSASESNSK